MRRCCVHDCKGVKFLYGRCRKHFQAITDPTVFEKLKNISSPEDGLAIFNRLIQPEPPTKWEYENPEGEAELMRLAELETPNDATKGRD